ncbi:alkaline phosphatase family protein [Flectobacillus rivi]|uniref:Alkaline phosphatase family protein n=1 Tax=Flectobacillus rivi TaxID=2984209 RepID=A0ABT6YYI4_9BACT|nr:alkaline phosphatase family protein [Flectobacillus rivi]MDI9873934.1 alkaline phosphatase family protein [Flectobacillus rivi]
MKKICVFLLLLLGTFYSQAQHKTEKVILITTDGFRWLEVFNGLDTALLNQEKYTKSKRDLIDRFGGSPQASRAKLLPFLWNTIASKGQIYGNREYNNFVNITNQQWFSYPGYNEILTGAPDDERITSNDHIDNPNETVLEFLHKKPAYKGKIAAFSTWDCFPFIINEKRSKIPVNSGKELVKNPNPREKLLNEIQESTPSANADRHDFITYYLAKEYLVNKKPKVLFMAFDETDDYAHAGNYDAYLKAANNFDRYLADLWKTVQSMPEYKDKTTLIITSDHGRGQYPKSGWTDHGFRTAYSDQIWFAVLGPDTPAKGEIKTAGQYYQTQFASTLAKFLGEKFAPNDKVGKPIKEVMNK